MKAWLRDCGLVFLLALVYVVGYGSGGGFSRDAQAQAQAQQVIDVVDGGMTLQYDWQGIVLCRDEAANTKLDALLARVP